VARKQIIIGIDPGVTGAIAVLDYNTAKLSSLVDMPTRKNLKGRNDVDSKELYEWFRKLKSSIVMVGIENVTAFATKSLAAAFTFGAAAYAPRAVCEVLDIPYRMFTSVEWKKWYKLSGKDKDGSRVLAIQRYPEADITKKSHHNRAEALLIAEYALKLSTDRPRRERRQLDK
jgi:crossover junction endodeoxyribonuclease RuvC